MNILIIGYGKMGKMVEEIALSKSDTIVGIIDKEEDWQTFDKNNKYKDIVAIDFSIPSKVLDNIEKAWERNIAIVVGTTGWYDKLEEITQRANQEKKTLFWASNFSIGVFLFNKLNAYLADMMKEYSDYNPSIKEIHHIHKLDAPSGTAITLAQTLVENHNIEKQNLNIESVREGEVCGTHIINYYSEVDDIEIKHTAHSRKGFASGAVMAAHWLKGKQGVFTMKENYMVCN
ncbi:MAG: 4-hydroxy-tetrahydrodipicolinate reductase, partial [Bacteroidales bacterium]|nr:4-hydroxy-tetrahydrodipicolinate reductase [Bacteroidales bacterium]